MPLQGVSHLRPWTRACGLRGSIVNVMSSSALILILVTASLDTSPSITLTAHDIEIAAYASTVAVVLTASAKCDDILVDKNLYAALKDSAHIVDEDKPALTSAVQANVVTFKKAIEKAPSLRTWCDTVFRLYGRPGELVPGLLVR